MKNSDRYTVFPIFFPATPNGSSRGIFLAKQLNWVTQLSYSLLR
jgi:hypothetical protein